MVGKSANRILVANGKIFNFYRGAFKGIFNGDYNNCRVVSQSINSGEYVLPGTVIELEFLYEEAIE